MEDWDDDFADGDAVVVPQAPLRLAVDPASMENWDALDDDFEDKPASPTRVIGRAANPNDTQTWDDDFAFDSGEDAAPVGTTLRMCQK